MKEKILSLTKKDFKVEFYCGSGAGGQRRNRKYTCCRITHLASGAVACATEQRSAKQNQKKALQRLVDTPKFKIWVNKVVYKIPSQEEIERQVDEMMKPEHLRVEYL